MTATDNEQLTVEDHHLWDTLTTAYDIISLDHTRGTIEDALAARHLAAEPPSPWEGPSAAGGYTHELIKQFRQQFPSNIQAMIPIYIISINDEQPLQTEQTLANIKHYQMILMGQHLVHNVKTQRVYDPLTGAEVIAKMPADLFASSRPVSKLPIFAPFHRAARWGKPEKAPYTNSQAGAAVISSETVVVPNLASYFETLIQWYERTDLVTAGIKHAHRPRIPRWTKG